MDISSLQEYLKGKISIICHHNADPDAIGAAYALQRLVKLIEPNSITEILYPDSASQLSEKIIHHYSIKASNHSNIIETNTVIVVDTGSLIQLESLRSITENAKNLIFIDHHGRDPEIAKLATLYISNEDAIATCEIISDIWAEFGFEPPKDVAEVLFLGIVFDSKHFGIGTSHLFQTAAKLMNMGATLNGARELLQTTMDNSERIARLKSAQRMTLYRIDTWLIVTSNLSSFQASAARGIIGLGADVAIIVGNDRDNLKASFRSTEEFHRKTDIHIGDDITKPLASIYGGEGGGHPTAAGMNGFGDPEEFLETAINYFSNKIGGLNEIL